MSVTVFVSICCGVWTDRTFGSVRSNRARNAFDYDEAKRRSTAVAVFMASAPHFARATGTPKKLVSSC